MKKELMKKELMISCHKKKTNLIKMIRTNKMRFKSQLKMRRKLMIKLKSQLKMWRKLMIKFKSQLKMRRNLKIKFKNLTKTEEKQMPKFEHRLKDGENRTVIFDVQRMFDSMVCVEMIDTIYDGCECYKSSK